jgi:hypothetical protein
MIDTKEMERILNLIESLPDNDTSVSLLKEFSEKHKNFSKILFDTNPKLSHDEWKQKCTQAKVEIDEFLGRLESMAC